VSEKKSAQALITRLPYDESYDPEEVLKFANQVDERGLIFVSIPIHPEAPNNGGELIYKLEQAGLYLCAKIVWHRDRHVVCSKSKRLTNAWEPLAVFSRSKSYVINRDAPAKIKKGWEVKETPFDEDSYLTCVGDHWAIRNDRRDRRYLPQTLVLNCIQLADLHPGDAILDPYGNPGVSDTCEAFGYAYRDGGAPSEIRETQMKATKK
jgi:DNA modification methylase